MRSETEEFTAEIEASETPQETARSFALYEEYSRKDMNQTIRKRRDSYENADSEERRRMEKEAKQEVDGFCKWLEQAKDMDHERAHYTATSLESILLGIPIGVQIALLFGTILDKHATHIH